MSLILDALKKAEQDRHAGQAPVMDELLVRRAPAAAARRRNTEQDTITLAAVIFALLFAAAGLVYWLWPAPQLVTATATRASAPLVASAAAEPAEPQAALRVDPERLEAPVADVPDDAVDTGETGAAQALSMDDLDGDPPQVAALKPAPQVAPAAAARASAQSPEPVTLPAAATPEPPPARPVAEAVVRALKEMPPAFRSEFPKLGVDVHVYDDNPLRRFVLINGKKYRETDTLIDGPRIVEIMPNGVIVEHRGSKVLLELPR